MGRRAHSFFMAVEIVFWILAAIQLTEAPSMLHLVWVATRLYLAVRPDLIKADSMWIRQAMSMPLALLKLLVIFQRTAILL